MLSAGSIGLLLRNCKTPLVGCGGGYFYLWKPTFRLPIRKTNLRAGFSFSALSAKVVA